MTKRAGHGFTASKIPAHMHDNLMREYGRSTLHKENMQRNLKTLKMKIYTKIVLFFPITFKKFQLSFMCINVSKIQ